MEHMGLMEQLSKNYNQRLGQHIFTIVLEQNIDLSLDELIKKSEFYDVDLMDPMTEDNATGDCFIDDDIDKVSLDTELENIVKIRNQYRWSQKTYYDILSEIEIHY